MTIVTQDSVANHIKPIFRALLPLILCGTAIGIYRLEPVFPVTRLHDDAGMRAQGLILPFLLLLSPLFLLVHGGFCYLSRKLRFNMKLVAAGFAILFLFLMILFLYKDASAEMKVRNVFLAFVSTILVGAYACGLNATRTAAPPAWNSIAGKIWVALSSALVTFNLLVAFLCHFGLVGDTPFRIYGLPLMSYGWFGLVWSLSGQWMKSLLFLLAMATIVLSLNLYSR